MPPGFVIGAPAYAAFCDEHDLRARLAAELSDFDANDTTALETAAGHARELVAQAPLPGWLHDEIVRSYRELAGEEGDVAVAVR